MGDGFYGFFLRNALCCLAQAIDNVFCTRKSSVGGPCGLRMRRIDILSAPLRCAEGGYIAEGGYRRGWLVRKFALFRQDSNVGLCHMPMRHPFGLGHCW
jgi:hypothetical protein